VALNAIKQTNKQNKTDMYIDINVHCRKKRFRI